MSTRRGVNWPIARSASAPSGVAPPATKTSAPGRSSADGAVGVIGPRAVAAASVLPVRPSSASAASTLSFLSSTVSARVTALELVVGTASDSSNSTTSSSSSSSSASSSFASSASASSVIPSPSSLASSFCVGSCDGSRRAAPWKHPTARPRFPPCTYAVPCAKSSSNEGSSALAVSPRRSQRLVCCRTDGRNRPARQRGRSRPVQQLIERRRANTRRYISLRASLEKAPGAALAN